MIKEKISLKNRNPILSLTYNAGLQMLAIGQMGDSKGGACLSLWNPFEKKLLKIVERNPYQNIGALRFDYSGKYLIYSDNSKLFIYDIATNNKRELQVDNDSITKISVSKLSPRIAVSGKYIEVLDFESGKGIWKLEDYQADKKTENLHIQGLPVEWRLSEQLPSFFNDKASIEIFEDGNSVLITGHNKAKVQQIDIVSGKVIKEIFPAPIQSTMLSLGCNERVVAVSSKVPYANFLWDLENSNRIGSEIFNERFGGYSSLCLHPKERLIANGSFVGFVSLQKIEDGMSLFSEKLHDGRVSQIIFGENDKTLFSGGDDGDVYMIKI